MRTIFALILREMARHMADHRGYVWAVLNLRRDCITDICVRTGPAEPPLGTNFLCFMPVGIWCLWHT